MYINTSKTWEQKLRENPLKTQIKADLFYLYKNYKFKQKKERLKLNQPFFFIIEKLSNYLISTLAPTNSSAFLVKSASLSEILVINVDGTDSTTLLASL